MIDYNKIITEISDTDTQKYDEKTKRRADIQVLVHGIIGRYSDFFARPENRLEFIKSQPAEDFYRIAQYVNAKVRGEKPRVLRLNPEEKLGASLPLLHTPKSSDKIPSFNRGFAAIQDYLKETADPVETQIEAVAMATEALIIWVHPFNDGNGRTSRFMSKLIESGASDTDELVEETVDAGARLMYYPQKLSSRESTHEIANNPDIILDDDERKSLRLDANSLPNDIEAMYLSVERLLNDKTIRQSVLETAEKHRMLQSKHKAV